MEGIAWLVFAFALLPGHKPEPTPLRVVGLAAVSWVRTACLAVIIVTFMFARRWEDRISQH